jgi:hypothetical protein
MGARPSNISDVSAPRPSSPSSEAAQKKRYADRDALEADSTKEEAEEESPGGRRGVKRVV